MQPPAERLSRLIDGYLSTQLLYVAAELCLADALVAGPCDAAELADTFAVDPDVLDRILRGLAADGVLDERPGRRFALAEMGELLREDHPRSLRGAVLARGRLYYPAMAELLRSAQQGRPPFDIAHGETFFAHLATRPVERAAFQASMTSRSKREADAVVAAYDFAAFTSIVDIGGGTGVLLAAIMESAPGIDGTLFDRPEVIDGAPMAGIGGDFFVDVPAGADAYVLSRVIHDWDDEAATTILRTCRRAMQESATLLLVEAILPDRAADDPAAIRMDLHMLTLLRGRERTRSEYEALLAAADLRLARVVPTGPTTGVHVVEARPVPVG
ncbi:acetylserotonin O-methyltransferase [Pseudonocardia sp. TRM90224]|uniref:acetylserotonin O-methyltransferase n=1 Tax=Pseudonocardia sp. TRM90224 TaxID=2812678 RepID=UPI001E5727EF|nr:acetylserotonin O-methyltransferase [Pseudonocardia sp. TRM90224]